MLSQVDFGNPEHLAATTSSGRVNPKTEGSEVSTKTCAEPVKVPLGFEQTSPQLLWVQEKEIGDLPPPDMEEDSFALQAGQVATLALFGVFNHIRLSAQLTFLILILGDPTGMGSCGALGGPAEPEPG